MCVSGHNSETSIRSYATKINDSTKLAMSNGLSSALKDGLDTRKPLQDAQKSLNIKNKTVTWN